ncbi:MAG: hypothetical protein Q4D29_13410, partial [Lachnospiraceae bacterium]|nr:hypothetical protein [Lachnospiraceae bacterium]
NHKSLPSMTSFIYICDYFGIYPKEFFDAKCTTILNEDSKYIFYGQQKLKSRHTFSKYGQ